MSATDQNKLNLPKKTGSHRLSADQKKGILALIVIIILFFIEVKIIRSMSSKTNVTQTQGSNIVN